MSLYVATDLGELKAKLAIYERRRQRMVNIGDMNETRRERVAPRASTSWNVNKQGTSNSLFDQGLTRCYNCNDMGHIATKCPRLRRDRGSCYICGSLEHQRALCPRLAQASRSQGNSKYLSRVFQKLHLKWNLFSSQILNVCI